MKLKHILTELFNSKLLYNKRIHWQFKSKLSGWIGHFIVDNIKFELLFDPILLTEYVYDLPKEYRKYGNKEIYNISFNVQGHNPDFKAENINHYKVFSIVGEGVVQLIKFDSPLFLLISYPTNVDERKKLYNKFSDLICKKFLYTKIYEDEQGIFLKSDKL